MDSYPQRLELGSEKISNRDGSAPSDETIYREIFSAIVEHRLRPGAKLTEDTLADVFGVSRTRIAKALQRLCIEKIATRHPHRGAFVAQPSIEDAREVFTARRLIEAETFKGAATKALPGDLQRLEELVVEENEARRAGNLRGTIQLSGQFHLAVAEMAGNKTLKSFLSELVARTSLILAIYQNPGQSGCDDHDHAMLVGLLSAKKGAAAAEKAVQHLLDIENNLQFEPEAPAIDLRDVFAKLTDETP